ncbi:hypothetical protein [Thermincola ferriacetica]|uniref:hypothetical protein n=1 Tax=Thermincola ferriacetica TaxID=281456 RepID=UPI00128DDBC1|nr:hypothetical protein [Thermincola ferriacetica]
MKLVKKKLIKELVFWSVIFMLATPKNAYAYIDPGTGSYMLQVLAGIVIGALIAIKTFWKSLKSFVPNIFNKGEEN